MPHLHTAPGQVDWTVSMFLVRTDGPEPRLLMHRHKTFGVLMQVGGHVELDESPWNAVVRELREETGYDADQVRVLVPPLRCDDLPDDVVHPPPVCLRSIPVSHVPAEHIHTDLAYAFVTAEPPRHPVGAGESTAIAWLTRGELVGLPTRETYEDARTLYLFILDRVCPAWEAVPASQFSCGLPAGGGGR